MCVQSERVCVCVHVSLHVPSLFEPPAVCHNSAGPQRGPRPSAWPRGPGGPPGSSKRPLHPEPRWSDRWLQYLHTQTQGLGMVADIQSIQRLKRFFNTLKREWSRGCDYGTMFLTHWLLTLSNMEDLIQLKFSALVDKNTGYRVTITFQKERSLVCMCVHVYGCVCACVCMCVCMCVYVCACVWLCVWLCV